MAITLQIRFFVTLASSAKMGVTGLELAANSLVRGTKMLNCGTTSGPALPTMFLNIAAQDAELCEVINAWASLPQTVRDFLLGIVRRSRNGITNEIVVG